MVVHELTRDECEDVLARVRVGRLACARRNQPYIVPISFAFDAVAHALVGFSTVGRKIEWMRENPKVCVADDEIMDDQHWITIVINGVYHEIAPADADLLRRVQALLQKRVSWWLPATARSVHRDARGTPVFYRILIREVTGRRTSSTPR